MAPWSVRSAMAAAMACVPRANFSLSNTPMGPFQITCATHAHARTSVLFVPHPQTIRRINKALTTY
eukprot:1194490-Prorocentrum_minimum.AAC.2